MLASPSTFIASQDTGRHLHMRFRRRSAHTFRVGSRRAVLGKADRRNTQATSRLANRVAPRSSSLSSASHADTGVVRLVALEAFAPAMIEARAAEMPMIEAAAD